MPRVIKAVAPDALQSALDQANGGDVIQLRAGTTYNASYVLPVHPGSDPVTIITEGPLPSEGTRVTPESAANFATIRAASGGLPAIRTAPAAAGWTIVGVHLPANPSGYGDIVSLGDGSDAQSSLDVVPQRLVIDRCYIHGDPTTGQKRGISLQSGDTRIVNCDIRNIFQVGQDTQAIAGWNGPGPWHIENTYLEAAGENFLVGGDRIKVPNLVPSDITFTRNTLTKQDKWLGQGFNVKNLLELKTGVRVVIDQNTLDWNWADAQVGIAVQLTVRNEEGNNPWATIRDVSFTRNHVRHAGGAINVLGLDDRGANYPSVLLTNLTIQDNEFWDIAEYYGGAARWIQIQRGDHITLDHNTVLLTQGGQAVSMYLLGDPQSHFVCTNNIFPNNGLSVFGDHGMAAGIPTLEEHAPGYQFARNAISGPTPPNYPPDAFYPPTINDVGFVDVANHDYRLAPTSAYVAAALDGTDIGARFEDAPLPPLPPLPGVVGEPHPPLNATAIPVDTILGWAPASDADSYTLLAGQTPTLAVVAVGLTEPRYTPLDNLAHDTQYFWQVIAVNAAGQTPGPVWTFTTAKAPPQPNAPQPPTMPVPAPESTILDASPIIGWSGGEGASYFTVAFGSMNPPPVRAAVIDPHFTPGRLARGATYYWQITARNADGATPGPVWSFRTAAAPATPVDPTPADGAHDVALDAALAWAVTPGARAYAVRFGTDNQPPLVSLWQTVPSYYPSRLEPGTTYFWQVIAINAFGGTPGPVWTFTTGAGA